MNTYPEFHIDSDTFELSYRFWDNGLLIVWPRGSKEYEWLSEWEEYVRYLDARAFVERYERENKPVENNTQLGGEFNIAYVTEQAKAMAIGPDGGCSEYPVQFVQTHWEMGADGWITIKEKLPMVSDYVSNNVFDGVRPLSVARVEHIKKLVAEFRQDVKEIIDLIDANDKPNPVVDDDRSIT